MQGFRRFLALPGQDRRDLFAATAERLDTLPSYVEKDFWVCLVLDCLYNRLPQAQPKLLFKGGTSLSKAFGLIRRFSEDIDLVIHREDLGFAGEHDPTLSGSLSGKKRTALFEDLKAACSHYVQGDLAVALASLLGDSCNLVPDEDDRDRQTLLIEYPSLYSGSDLSYVAPRVKLEGGARSALDPTRIASITSYVAEDLPEDWPSLEADNIRTLDPARTYLEKLLILHGVYYGHHDEGRLPTDRDRVSRHYYDAAVMTETEVGRLALADERLLDAVRNHNLIAFRQAWKRFEKAVPGQIRLVPGGGLRAVIERDYGAMQGMMLGEAPAFDWVLEQLQTAEDRINRREM